MMQEIAKLLNVNFKEPFELRYNKKLLPCIYRIDEHGLSFKNDEGSWEQDDAICFVLLLKGSYEIVKQGTVSFNV